MNLDQVNKWLMVAANLGVMGGLVLVAMQMRLNTETVRLQNAGDLYRGFAAGELVLMGDTSGAAWVTAVLHPDELTEEQFGGQLWAYYNNMMWVAQNNWHAHEEGLATDESWDFARKFVAASLGFRVARIWWEQSKGYYEPEFSNVIDAELAQNDPDEVERSLRQMLDTIGSLDQKDPRQVQQDAESMVPAGSEPKR